MRPGRTSSRTLMGRMLSRRVHMLVEIPVEPGQVLLNLLIANFLCCSVD